MEDCKDGGGHKAPGVPTSWTPPHTPPHNNIGVSGVTELGMTVSPAYNSTNTSGRGGRVYYQRPEPTTLSQHRPTSVLSHQQQTTNITQHHLQTAAQQQHTAVLTQHQQTDILSQQQQQKTALLNQQLSQTVVLPKQRLQQSTAVSRPQQTGAASQQAITFVTGPLAGTGSGAINRGGTAVLGSRNAATTSPTSLVTTVSSLGATVPTTNIKVTGLGRPTCTLPSILRSNSPLNTATPPGLVNKRQQQPLKTLGQQQAPQQQQLVGLQRVHSVTVPAGAAVSSAGAAQPVMTSGQQTTAKPTSLRLWLSPSSASGQSSGTASSGRVTSDGTTTNTVFLPSGFDVTKLYPELSKLGFVRSANSSSNPTTTKLVPVVSSSLSMTNSTLGSSLNSGAVVTTSVLTTLSSMGNLTRTSATNLTSNPSVVNSYQVVSNTSIDSQATLNAIGVGGNNSNKNVGKTGVRQYISVASLANAGVLQNVPNKNNGGQQTSSAFVNVIKVAGGGAGGSTGGGTTARLKVVSGRGSGGGGNAGVLLAPVSEPSKQGSRMVTSHDGARMVSVQCGSGGANSRQANAGGNGATVTSAGHINNSFMSTSSPSFSSSNIINNNNCTKDNTALIVVSRNSSFNRCIGTSTTAGVASESSVLNTLPDRNGTLLCQRVASTSTASSGAGANGALSTERSIREAEARQKQLQLQRQLQQIHGGLSRAGLSSPATVTPVKQFRLSQQQVASLLSQSSAISSLPQSISTSSGGLSRQVVSLASAGGQNAVFVTSPAGQGNLFSTSAAPGTVLSSGQETVFTLQRQSGVAPGQQGSPVLVSAAHGTVFSPMIATTAASKRKASPMSAYSPRSAKTMRAAAGTAVVVEGVQVPGSSQVIDPAGIRRQRDIRTKRKADREAPETPNGYARQRSTAPHNVSTNHQSKIKGNTCDSSSSIASPVEATSSIITSLGTSSIHPSSNCNVKSSGNLSNETNYLSERTSSTAVKDSHVFSLPVLTNARVSSILKDITLPDQQQSQLTATVLKPTDSVVSSILKDYTAASERTVLLSPGLGRRVSFSPETVERLGPSGRKVVRDSPSSSSATTSQYLSSAANSLNTGDKQAIVTLPENRSYSRKNRAVNMPVAHRGTASPERCENTPRVTEQLSSSDAVKGLTVGGASKGYQGGLELRCASVQVLPRIMGLPSLVRETSRSRWPSAVLRLHDTLVKKHNASSDMLPAGLHDLDIDDGGDSDAVLTSLPTDTLISSPTHADNLRKSGSKAASKDKTRSIVKSELKLPSEVLPQAKRESMSRVRMSRDCPYEPSQTSAEVLSLLQHRLMEAKEGSETKPSVGRPSAFLQREQEGGRRLWCRVRAHKARQGGTNATKMLVQAARHSPSLTAVTLAHVRGVHQHSPSLGSSAAAGEAAEQSRSVTPPTMLLSRQLSGGDLDSLSAVELPSGTTNKRGLRQSCLLESRFCAYEITLPGSGGISSSTTVMGGSTASLCGLPALPGTRHCLRHITYNVDQQLFSQCCARTADGVGAMCRVPVFALTEQPMCPMHRAAEAQDATTSSSSPCSPASSRKPRKKGKLTTLSRYGKRKRRRSSTPHSHSGGKGGKGGGKGGGKACGKGKGSGKVVPSTAVRPPMNNGLVLSRTPSFSNSPYDLLPSSPPNTPAFTPACSECGGGADGGCGCCCDREDGSLDGSLDASLELPGNVVAAASRLLDLHDLLLDHDQHEEDLFSQQTDAKEPLVCQSENGNKSLAVSCPSMPAGVAGVDSCHLASGDLLPPASHQLYPCSSGGSQAALQQSAADSGLTAAALASYASVMDQTNPIDSMISSSFNQQELNVINQFLGNIVGPDASMLLSQPPTDTTNTVMSASTAALPAVSSAITCLSATSCSPTHTGLPATANTAVPSTTHGNHCDVPPHISAVTSIPDVVSNVAVATPHTSALPQLVSCIGSSITRSLGTVTAGVALYTSNEQLTDTAFRLSHQSGLLTEANHQQASYIMNVQGSQSVSTCSNTMSGVTPSMSSVTAASRECPSVVASTAQTPRHSHLFNGTGHPAVVSVSSQSVNPVSIVPFDSSPSVCNDAAVASFTAATCNTTAMIATMPLAATAAAAVVSCPTQTGGCTVSNSPASLDTALPDASATFNQLPSPSMPPTPSDDDMTTMVEFPSATEQRHNVGQLDSDGVTAFEPCLTELEDEEGSLGQRQTTLLSPRRELRRTGHEVLLCRGGDCKGLPTGFSLLDAAQNALPHLH